MYVAILIMTVELMTKVETIEFLLPTYKDCMLVGQAVQEQLMANKPQEDANVDLHCLQIPTSA